MMGRKKNISNSVISVVFCLLVIYDAESGRPEFPEDMKEIIIHIHNVCVDNTGVSEGDISKCEEGIFANDRKLKCYMFCLLEEASFVDENGIVDYDMLISMIPDEWRDKVGSMITECRHVDTPDKENCDKAMDFHKCLYKSNPDLYFLF